MKKYIFPFLVALSALSLAGAAAFFSVSGLSKLFGGAKTEVIVMASALEFAKLVTASFLHRYWKQLTWQIKTYLTIGVVTVMIITSAGIYGFLSNAYSITANKLQNVDTQVQMVDAKKVIMNSEINRLQENKTLKSNRVQSLVDLRSHQEARVDSLYNRRQTASAKRVEEQIVQSTKEIGIITIEIDSISSNIQRKYNEISALDLEVLDLKNNDVNSEVGPLRYIAKLTGKDMDSVVNFFILLLIFVFDPLAVTLVIATNISMEKEFGKKKEEEAEEPKVEPVVEPVEPIIETTEEVKEVFSAEDKIRENKKNDEVVKYVTDENGAFKVEKKETPVLQETAETKKILNHIKSKGIENNSNYLNFLDVLFEDGNLQVGDTLIPYSQFLDALRARNIKFTEKETIDFLTICNLFEITHMPANEGERRYLSKTYEVSKSIISLLSK